MLSLKLDFYKVKAGIALYMEWLLKTTVVQQFEKKDDLIKRLQDLLCSVQRMTFQLCFYANMGIMYLSRVIDSKKKIAILMNT